MDADSNAAERDRKVAEAFNALFSPPRTDFTVSLHTLDVRYLATQVRILREQMQPAPEEYSQQEYRLATRQLLEKALRAYLDKPAELLGPDLETALQQARELEDRRKGKTK